jgi:phage/plasmid-like protein (TIGR03299 family)
MPANINSMMYVGDKPWHQLGTRLQNIATSEEAITAARLGWSVAKEPVFLKGSPTPIPNQFAVVRSDNRTPLGIVGKRYVPLQNKDAFRFFDALVGIKEAIYHTAGALGNGEVIWILAKLNGVVRVVGEDITEKYLLLTNCHNGGGAVQILWTPIRVVCHNTLNVAVGARADNLHAYLRHTANLGAKVEEVQQALGIINAKFMLFEQMAKRLTAVQLTQDAWKNYVKGLHIAPLESGQDRYQKVLSELTPLFEKGRGNDLSGVRGTAWAAFNAVAEYADYSRSYRSEDNRAKSILFGSGAKLKRLAWDLALTVGK